MSQTLEERYLWLLDHSQRRRGLPEEFFGTTFQYVAARARLKRVLGRNESTFASDKELSGMALYVLRQVNCSLHDIGLKRSYAETRREVTDQLIDIIDLHNR